MLAQGKSYREIGKAMGRHHTTISREIQTNAPPIHKGYYLAHKAHERATERRVETHKRPRLKDEPTRKYVVKMIKKGWSPEQIMGRIAEARPGLAIGYEAIYQYIYEEQPQLIQYLARSHRRRFPRGHSRKHRPLRSTVTLDNGPENTEHERITAAVGARTFFCAPFHSWEKGTVENTIGLVRRFFPKKTDFARVSYYEVKKVERLLNNRPRKCLNYATPQEVLSGAFAGGM